MKLKSPIKKFKDEKIYQTLPYGDKTYLNAYKRLGWDLAYHNGSDLTNSIKTARAYGTPVISAQKGRVQKVFWDSPMSTKGNGIIIEGEPFTDDWGQKRLLCTIYWHLSAIEVKAGDLVKEGQVIGRLGNSGFVIGGKTNPTAGTHIHFMVCSYIEKDGKWQLEFPNNGVHGAVDPLIWLESGWQDNAPIISFQDYESWWEVLKQMIKEFLKGRV